MIVSNLTGGIGNQLFQYAAGFTLTQEQSFQLKLHFTNALFCTKRNYELEIFATKPILATKQELKRLRFAPDKLSRILERSQKELGLNHNRFIIYEDQLEKPQDFFSIPDNRYLIGYWQDHNFYHKHQAKLRQELTFSSEFKKSLAANLKRIKAQTPSVGLHFRRGDFVKYQNELAIPYYHQALQVLTQKLGTYQPVIFSDDIAWVKENFVLKNACYVDFTTSGGQDLYLLSCCDHQVIANSTFSWWGAWFNSNPQKIVIAPLSWDKISSGALCTQSMLTL
jgi:hypothetical protein